MKKTNLISLGFIIIISFFLTACPYTSTVPLSEATVKIDNSIIGDWIVQNELDYPNYLHITRISDTKVKIEQYEYDESYEIFDSYECHFTDIGKTRFANALDVDGNYNLYKIDITNNTLVLYEVTNNIDEVFNDSKKMYKFFQENKDYSFFYNSGEETYIKGDIPKVDTKETTPIKLSNQLKNN